jgi:hypothetical protein
MFRLTLESGTGIGMVKIRVMVRTNIRSSVNI